MRKHAARATLNGGKRNSRWWAHRTLPLFHPLGASRLPSPHRSNISVIQHINGGPTGLLRTYDNKDYSDDEDGAAAAFGGGQQAAAIDQPVHGGRADSDSDGSDAVVVASSRPLRSAAQQDRRGGGIEHKDALAARAAAVAVRGDEKRSGSVAEHDDHDDPTSSVSLLSPPRLSRRRTASPFSPSMRDLQDSEPSDGASLDFHIRMISSQRDAGGTPAEADSHSVRPRPNPSTARRLDSRPTRAGLPQTRSHELCTLSWPAATDLTWPRRHVPAFPSHVSSLLSHSRA
jgi:hypothetical protein